RPRLNVAPAEHGADRTRPRSNTEPAEPDFLSVCRSKGPVRSDVKPGRMGEPEFLSLLRSKGAVRSERLGPPGPQTLNLKSTTSPSAITYSLPSRRTLPAALASAIEP